jgi:integrase
VSSESSKRADAVRLLKEREGDVAKGLPITADVGKICFEEAAEDLLTDYRVNKKRSLRTVRLRLKKHLTPFFGDRRLATITLPLVRQYVAKRQEAGASNATINRDLITLKRMFTLAMQGGKLMTRPYIPLLKETNVRKGFFEREQLQNVANQLPPYMRGIAEFAFVTGWRTPSEILPLEWRQVDMKAGEVRLDPGTTKNGEGRVFPFTKELRHVLERQQVIAETLKRERGIIPRSVFCFTIGRKAGKQISDSGYNHAWGRARVAAGCPGRSPHDCRRTAVRNLVRAGVPERVAMQLTGHRTRAVFERYNIVSPGDLREAAQRLDAYASAAG